MLFDLQLIDVDGWVVVSPVGELDLANAPAVRQAVVQRVTNGDRRFVLDLGGVDFVDSTGLGLVVALAKRIRAHDGELRLARATPGVWALFELTGLDRLWRCHATVDEAVDATGSRRGAARERTEERTDG